MTALLLPYQLFGALAFFVLSPLSSSFFNPSGHHGAHRRRELNVNGVLGLGLFFSFLFFFSRCAKWRRRELHRLEILGISSFLFFFVFLALSLYTTGTRGDG